LETPRVLVADVYEFDRWRETRASFQVIPSVKKEEAIRCFVEAQMTGTSVIIVVTEEHAEHYAQQLKRQQIYAKIEKDE
jgi:ATP-dependent Clp protease adapter protein ClpS